MWKNNLAVIGSKKVQQSSRKVEKRRLFRMCRAAFPSAVGAIGQDSKVGAWHRQDWPSVFYFGFLFQGVVVMVASREALKTFGVAVYEIVCWQVAYRRCIQRRESYNWNLSAATYQRKENIVKYLDEGQNGDGVMETQQPMETWVSAHVHIHDCRQTVTQLCRRL